MKGRYEALAGSVSARAGPVPADELQFVEILFRDRQGPAADVGDHVSPLSAVGAPAGGREAVSSASGRVSERSERLEKRFNSDRMTNFGRR